MTQRHISRRRLRRLPIAVILIAGLVAAFTAIAHPASAAGLGLEITQPVQTPTDSAPNGGHKEIRAACSPGKQFLGASYVISGAEGLVGLDTLVPDPTGVTVGATEFRNLPGQPANGTNLSWTLVVKAICANPLPGYQIVPQDSVAGFGSQMQATAVCPSGKQQAGGGGKVNNARGLAHLGSVLPFFDGITAEADVIRANGNVNNWSETTYAICTNPLAGRFPIIFGRGPVDNDTTNAKLASADCAPRSLISVEWSVSAAFDVVTTAISISPTGVTTVAYPINRQSPVSWTDQVLAQCANP